MNKSMGVIDSMSKSLMDDKSVDDPDDVIEYDELSLKVTKTTAQNLDNTTVTTMQGEMTMPKLADAFPDSDGSCIENTVGHEHTIYMSIS